MDLNIVITELKKLVGEVRNGNVKYIDLRGVIRIVSILQKSSSIKSKKDKELLVQLRTIIMDIKADTKGDEYTIKELEEQIEALKRRE